MNEVEQDGFRSQLLALKAELQTLQEDSSEGGKPVQLDQAKVGRLSRMDALQGQQMALEASRRRQQQLHNIESALRRLDAGDYGFCIGCDEEIDPRRLAVDPASTYCISCAQKLG